MLLLTGPPASGKTSACIDELRKELRAKRSDCRLLLPTTTMAEHLRNELAREGVVFSPKIVSTFGKFVSDYPGDLPGLNSCAFELIVEGQLAKLPLARYAGVRDYPGFRSALVRTLDEFSGANGGEEHLAATDPDFALVWTAVRDELRHRKLHTRAELLKNGAERIRFANVPGKIWITGFVGFTHAEIAVLRALDDRCDLVVTVTDSPGSETTLATLRSFAKAERRIEQVRDNASRILVPASTVDSEAIEIARRILEERNHGRAFREMGVIVRSETPSVPALRASFERFGIPFRSYFAQPLRTDPTVRYLLGLVDGALGGWDHEAVLPVLRMHGSPLEIDGDKFEHSVAECAPSSGLESLKSQAPASAGRYFESLLALSQWPEAPQQPAVWSKRFCSLQTLFEPGRIEDGVTPERALLWRTANAAIENFAAAAVETAAALAGGGEISCAEFRKHLEIGLATVSLHVVDRRRDVVHIIDAVEARQWRLPVIFVCGLLEDQFPKHHTEDPILNDAQRRALNALGLPLKTSTDRQAEERHLFDVVLSRATQLLVLSYARLNAKGEPNLPSFLLERVAPCATEEAKPIQPAFGRMRWPEPAAAIVDEQLRSELSQRHGLLSASKVESFLNCPWNFFASRTLRLKEPPVRPWDRLSSMVQGTIGHAVFEAVFRDRVLLNDVFDAAFEAACEQHHIPAGYRTEAIRMELLHGIEHLVNDGRLLPHRGSTTLFEKEFTFVLSDGVSVRGQIDRLEVDANRNAVIFDYKYKREYRIKSTVRDNEEGKRVQSGLYLLAARHLGYTPAGMVYSGFKRESSAGGWVLPGLRPELQATCSSEHLADVIAKAREVTLLAHSDISGGRIRPAPVDARVCEFCCFAAVCRVESMPETVTAGGGFAAE